MGKEVKLYLREVHLHKGIALRPFNHVIVVCPPNERAEVVVVNGVGYTPIFRDGYGSLFAALRDTPEELEKNPDVKLTYIAEEYV